MGIDKRDIKVVLKPGDEVPVYSNFVNINHGPHDFRITFGLTVIPPGGLPEDTETIEALTSADVIVPASEMPSLIEILSRNYGTWQKTYTSEEESDASNDT